MHTKRVLVITFNNISNDSRVIRETNALIRSGHDVSVASFSHKNDATKKSLGFAPLYFQWEHQYTLLKNVLFFGSVLILLNTLFSYLKNYNTLFYLGLACSVFLLALSFTMIILNLFLPKRWYSLRRRYLPRLQYYFYTRFCLKITLKTNPEVIHCHDISTLTVGINCKKASDCKLIFDAHEVYEDLYGIEESLKEVYTSILKNSLPEVDEIITVNEFISEFYKNQYDFSRPIHTIKNSASLSNKVVKNTRLINTTLGLNPDTKTILYQGGYSRGRGLEKLIDSAKHFPSDWILCLMGWGELEINLKDQANELNILNHKVFFLPKVPPSELNQWTASAEVGIIPYEVSCLNHELCSPNKLWEFARAGLPIISTDSKFLRSEITRNKIGWILPKNYNELYLGDFLNSISKETHEQISINTIRYFEKNNWPIEEKKLVKIFDQI